MLCDSFWLYYPYEDFEGELRSKTKEKKNVIGTNICIIIVVC